MNMRPANLNLEALAKRIDALERENARLRAENQALKAENKRLRLELASAKKNSRNSSKPPSSDIVKPPPPGGKSKRHIGGQPGHEPHFRNLFTPEQLDEAVVFVPSTRTCPCGGTLVACPVSDQVRQQIELRENPLFRREYRARAYRCSSCGAFRREKLPRCVGREGFVGDRLSAALAFLNAKARASHSALAAFMRDVCGEPVSRGQIAKTFRRVSHSLEAPYAEALKRLRDEPFLNIDETGHRERGKRFWTWVFRAGDFAVFRIDKTRGSGVLQSVLGSGYKGTIGCDYFSAYHKYLQDSGASAQFCMAHLIRDIRFLKEHPDPETRRYAFRSLKAAKQLFRTHHRLRENPEHDRRELIKAGERLRRTLVSAPPQPKAQNIARRFRDNGNAYLRFINNPKIEPTNNRAEQAIRQVVIDRVASQGTRGAKGRAYKERMWTVISTCAMRGASSFDFLRHALRSNVASTPPPLLHTL